jgi:hypothetical protein
LRDLIVQPGFANLFDKDLVGVLSDRDLGTSDLSQDTDRESRSGERVSHDQVFGNLEESSESSNLICVPSTRISVLASEKEIKREREEKKN